MSEEPEEPVEKPIGLRVREEKIAEVTVANIDCSMMDARTRQVLLYLVKQEKKKLKTFPTSMAAESMAELEGIEAGLKLCKAIRTRKGEENTVQRSSSEGESEGPSQED